MRIVIDVDVVLVNMDEQTAYCSDGVTRGRLRMGSGRSPEALAAAELRALGYVEGGNLAIEYRWSEGNLARLPGLARELVQDGVEIILAGGSTGAQAARDATSLIPIIAAGAGDLVELPAQLQQVDPAQPLLEAERRLA